MKIGLSKKAETSLENIQNYLIATFGNNVSKKSMLNIYNEIKGIADFPYANPKFTSNEKVRFKALKKNVILYEIKEKEDTIFIINVYSNGQNWHNQE